MVFHFCTIICIEINRGISFFLTSCTWRLIQWLRTLNTRLKPSWLHFYTVHEWLHSACHVCEIITNVMMLIFFTLLVLRSKLYWQTYSFQFASNIVNMMGAKFLIGHDWSTDTDVPEYMLEKLPIVAESKWKLITSFHR